MNTVLPHWRRNFNIFLTGQFFSGITSMIVQYSLIWYLTTTTHSATVLSFAMMLGILPMSTLILLDVVGAIVGTILLLQVTLPRTAAQGETIHVVTDAVAGYHLLRGRSGLWAIVLIETLFTLFLLPAASLYPLMTIAHFHGTVAQAGTVEVAYSAGMLAGGVLISILGTWRDRVKPILMAYLLIGITLLLSGLVPGTALGFWLFVGLNTLAEFAAPFFSTVSYAMV
jgi:DHA3 family macrolide efflux protein-like MFS transporter